jgi:hypothetical protein
MAVLTGKNGTIHLGGKEVVGKLRGWKVEVLQDPAALQEPVPKVKKATIRMQTKDGIYSADLSNLAFEEVPSAPIAEPVISPIALHHLGTPEQAELRRELRAAAECAYARSYADLLAAQASHEAALARLHATESAFPGAD